MVAEIVRAGARSPTNGLSSSTSSIRSNGPGINISPLPQLQSPISPAGGSQLAIDIRNPNSSKETKPTSIHPTSTKKSLELSQLPPSKATTEKPPSGSSETSLITPPRTPKAIASSVNLTIFNNQGIQTDKVPTPAPVIVEVAAPRPETTEFSTQTEIVEAIPEPAEATEAEGKVHLELKVEEVETLRRRMRAAKNVEECWVLMDVLLAQLQPQISLSPVDIAEPVEKPIAPVANEEQEPQEHDNSAWDLVTMLLDGSLFALPITSETPTPTATPTVEKTIEEAIPPPQETPSIVVDKQLAEVEDEAIPRNSVSSFASTEADIDPELGDESTLRRASCASLTTATTISPSSTSASKGSPKKSSTTPPRQLKVARASRGPMREKRVLPTYVPPSSTGMNAGLVVVSTTPAVSPRASQEITTA
jgi:hypothetical protein